MTTCTKCRVEKSPADFYKHVGKRNGLRSWCKDCTADHDHVRYISTVEKSRARSLKWKRDNFEKDKQTHRAWMAANLEKNALYHGNRRARKLNQLGIMPPRAYEIIYELFGRACLKCGSPDNVTMDHIIPLALGGLHDISNLQPLCKSCNSSKGGWGTTDYRKIDFQF
jgi:5-methylcytosine-specific restriction endonuclease McrA